jgi:hypothetical protein
VHITAGFLESTPPHVVAKQLALVEAMHKALQVSGPGMGGQWGQGVVITINGAAHRALFVSPTTGLHARLRHPPRQDEYWPESGGGSGGGGSGSGGDGDGDGDGDGGASGAQAAVGGRHYEDYQNFLDSSLTERAFAAAYFPEVWLVSEYMVSECLLSVHRGPRRSVLPPSRFPAPPLPPLAPLAPLRPPVPPALPPFRPPALPPFRPSALPPFRPPLPPPPPSALAGRPVRGRSWCTHSEPTTPG